MSKFEELLCNLTEVDIILGGPAHDALVEYVARLEAEVKRLQICDQLSGHLVDKYKAQADEVQRRLEEAEAENARLRKEVERLREEIDAIGKARHKDIVTLGGLYLENKSLKAELARLREAARWIPVEERLPENNNAVLVIDGGHSIVEGSYVLGRWVAFSEGRYIHPTHWRPRPEPPEVE